MSDDILTRVGPYSLVKRATEHGYIVRTAHCSFHVMYDGERLCRSADVQRLRSELPHIAKWALNEINNYAASKAQLSKDVEHDTSY